MEVLDQLIFLGEAKGHARGRTPARGRSDWLDRLGLPDWGKRKVEELSKGMQQKVQFIGTLLHDPDLVILDEPFSGLDPVNLQVMKDVVVELARSGRTVLFSTHIMEQAERMCDRIAIIARGEKVVDGRIADIKAEVGGRHVASRLPTTAPRRRPVLADRTPGGARPTTTAPPPKWSWPIGADPDRLLRALVDARGRAEPLRGGRAVAAVHLHRQGRTTGRHRPGPGGGPCVSSSRSSAGSSWSGCTLAPS